MGELADTSLSHGASTAKPVVLPFFFAQTERSLPPPLLGVRVGGPTRCLVECKYRLAIQVFSWGRFNDTLV